LGLKPFCIHIHQESQPPETKTDQAKTHKACHSNEAGALIISQAEMLFGISDTQFRSEAHGMSVYNILCKFPPCVKIGNR